MQRKCYEKYRKNCQVKEITRKGMLPRNKDDVMENKGIAKTL